VSETDVIGKAALLYGGGGLKSGFGDLINEEEGRQRWQVCGKSHVTK
jgi:hypothetical protein